MLKYKEKAESNISWLIGKGELDALKDSWLDCNVEELAGDCQVKDLFTNNVPNEGIIKQYLGSDAWVEIKHKNITLTPDNDKIIWKATTFGNFSLFSSWNLVRARRENFTFYKFIWSKHTPPRVSIFIRRLL